MKTKRKSIFRTTAVTIMCIALSYIISCKSGTRSDDMTDTTGTGAIDKMKADSIKADSMKAASMKTDTMKPESKPTKKKGIATVSEPIPEVTEEIKEDKNKVYNHAEVDPVFPGGQSALDDYIKDNIKYPAPAMENEIEGKVLIQFIVDENGNVTGTTVLSKPLGYGIEQEAMRVVSNMPQWTPGKVKGKNVKTYRLLPITFTLQ